MGNRLFKRNIIINPDKSRSETKLMVPVHSMKFGKITDGDLWHYLLSYVPGNSPRNPLEAHPRHCRGVAESGLMLSRECREVSTLGMFSRFINAVAGSVYGAQVARTTII